MNKRTFWAGLVTVAAIFWLVFGYTNQSDINFILALVWVIIACAWWYIAGVDSVMDDWTETIEGWNKTIVALQRALLLVDQLKRDIEKKET